MAQATDNNTSNPRTTSVAFNLQRNEDASHGVAIPLTGGGQLPPVRQTGNTRTRTPDILITPRTTANAHSDADSLESVESPPVVVPTATAAARGRPRVAVRQQAAAKQTPPAQAGHSSTNPAAARIRNRQENQDAQMRCELRGTVISSTGIPV
jgi:hypothetical protein